jgi:hypothetical protein
VHPTARAVFAIARADLRERTRRYPFLWALGLTCWLGWLASEGTLRVQLGDFRGRLDSAWIGSSLAVIASTMLGLVGFWLARGSVERDRATGVGPVLATTPLSRGAYLAGKWLSHVGYLGALLALLGLAAVAMTLRNGDGGLDLLALWSPLLLLALPGLAFVSGLVVAFEVVPGLRGGFGNVAWFFAWGALFAASMQLGPNADFSGMGLARESMRAAIRAEHGVDERSFTVGGGPHEAARVFTFRGVEWDAASLARRLGWIGFGVLAALAATPFFDRFDPARRLPSRPAAPAPSAAVPEAVLAPATPRRDAIDVQRLPRADRSRLAVAALLLGELRRILRGRSTWWWLASAGVLVAAFTGADPRGPGAFALLWPVLLWSRLGAPDVAVAPLLAACPHPVRTPLVARALAGLILGAPFVLARAAGGAGTEPTVFAAALAFPPALALALGAVAGTPKAFEATWTALWYLALQTPSLDFFGATPTPRPGPFLVAIPGLLLIAALVAGRRR